MFFINPRKVRNLIESCTINKCKLHVNLESENYVSIQFIILSLLVCNVYLMHIQLK